MKEKKKEKKTEELKQTTSTGHFLIFVTFFINHCDCFIFMEQPINGGKMQIITYINNHKKYDVQETDVIEVIHVLFSHNLACIC
jgi:hypothetical protein